MREENHFTINVLYMYSIMYPKWRNNQMDDNEWISIQSSIWEGPLIGSYYWGKCLYLIQTRISQNREIIMI
jgi:hypothetical protein